PSWRPRPEPENAPPPRHRFVDTRGPVGYLQETNGQSAFRRTFRLSDRYSSPPTGRFQDMPRDPARSCVHEMFEHQVERAPEAIALVCGDDRLTYAELNRRANRLARRLRTLGAATDAIVPIVLAPSSARVVAILGTLKAGAAWLPLDPCDPEERLA